MIFSLMWFLLFAFAFIAFAFGIKSKKKIITNTDVGSLPLTFFLGVLRAHTVLKEILVLK